LWQDPMTHPQVRRPGWSNVSGEAVGRVGLPSRSWMGFLIVGQLGLSMERPAAYLWALGRLNVRGKRSPFAVSIRGRWLAARDRAQCEVGYETLVDRLHIRRCIEARLRRRRLPAARGGWASSLRATTFAASIRASSHARLRSSAGGERISAPAICSVAARLV